MNLQLNLRPPAPQAVLQVSRLSLRRNAVRSLLQHLDLELLPGERLGLRGANGSGKSTLLQALMGLHPLQGGAIEITGRLCRSEADFEALRGVIGLLFQDSDDQLFCPTVQEDVAFGPLNQGLPAAQVRAQVEHSLAQLRILPLAQRPIHQLSGGEKRLVALAGILAMQPQVLLLDEPVSGLDAQARQRVLDVLRALPQAMIVVDHDHAFLEQLCTRQLLLQDGRLQPLAPA
ncbi:cobalt/nickel transport system ATP-binding protein [Solimonas aquatica]|uniref:Cobalt/nickel transport system ATP-binding protein n=1 Tax=Solimonas aquatica TaxID=489703 RepID=A0A1H9KX06_9GAMM|nr:ABC transporter ATP-binding protein [Solimonas aquatica]SER03539.1 cobalt/nickel transport system ATP-binding protein [Solimonas aquatica]